MLKALFFDFGDTLISNRVFNLGGNLKAIEKVIQIYDMDNHPSEHLSLAKEAQEYIVEKVISGEWLRRSDEDSQAFSVRLKKAMCAKLIELIGEDANEERVEQVYEAYLQGIGTADSLFPETREVLETLKGAYKLGLISNNMIQSVTGPFRYLKLEGFFDVVIISAEENVDKPDPEIFHRALKRMGVTASEAMMVGDHPIDDVQGAKGVGMTAVWVNRSGEKPDLDVEPDYIITNLRELLDIV